MGNRQAAPSNGSGDWRIHLIWGTVLVLGAAAGFGFYKFSFDKAGQAFDRAITEAKAAARKAEEIAEKFNTGTISETFTAQIPSFVSAGMGNLELGQSTSVEYFRREDSRHIFWDSVYLGTTVSEIRTPVTYRYHLRFSDAWRFDTDGTRLQVIAPIIRPSLPPAVHLDEMEKKTTSGWGRFNKDWNLEKLEKEIMPKLEDYASDEQHLGLVREECRLTAQRFFMMWYLMQPQFQDEGITAVDVRFADEVGENAIVSP